MSAKRVLPSVVELFVVAAIVGGLVALMYPVVQSTRNPKGPHGEMIPVVLPDEANRITHPTGLSIIAPVNWDQIRDMGPDVPFLCIAARGIPGRRLKSVITISQCDPPTTADLNRCNKVTLGNAAAWETMQIDRHVDDARSSYNLYAFHGTNWWCVNFLVADAMTALPIEVRRYLDTIRFP